MSIGLATILLLVASNAFMLLAWYGHLKWNFLGNLGKAGLISAILLSWGIALFEYCLMIPANRIGYKEQGGPFSLIQLKVIQEVIHLGLFGVFVVLFFKGEQLAWNHYLAAVFLVAAVWLVFK